MLENLIPSSYYSGIIELTFISGRGVAGSSLTGATELCPRARHIYPCLVPVQPMKTCPDITEKNADWEVTNQIKETNHLRGAMCMNIILHYNKSNTTKIEHIVCT